ncbi:MAG TPA: zinc-binding dehydrogenase [Gaiellaceae bacterium]
MRAVELRAFGGPEGLVATELADPVPGPGEATVDLVAAALNRREWWIRRGGQAALPAVLGSDGAGVVSAVGADVDGVAVGDEVVIYPGLAWGDDDEVPGPDFEILGVPSQGTYAERIVLPADLLFPRPAGWSWAETAALPVAGLTAWRALVRYAHAEPGKTILVTGGGGGVGTFAVQIAASLGCRVVTTSSSAEKLKRLRELGAADGADYRDHAWPERIAPVDAVIDSIGGSAWTGALRALRPGGVLVCFGDTEGDVGEIVIADLFFRYLSVHGTTLGSPREFDDFLAYCAAASWRPVLDSVFPLTEIQAAHRRLDAPDRFGKIVLAIDESRL